MAYRGLIPAERLSMGQRSQRPCALARIRPEFPALSSRQRAVDQHGGFRSHDTASEESWSSPGTSRRWPPSMSLGQPVQDTINRSTRRFVGASTIAPLALLVDQPHHAMGDADIPWFPTCQGAGSVD